MAGGVPTRATNRAANADRERLHARANFASKHESEKLVRAECQLPWRIYRPGIVVGDSRSGEMDKIDGPYYFFKLLQKMRSLLPSWMPNIGVEGGRLIWSRSISSSPRSSISPIWTGRTATAFT